MSTINSGVNQLESKVGGKTVDGRVHSLSAWFVLALRLMMGYAFAYSGFSKITGEFVRAATSRTSPP